MVKTVAGLDSGTYEHPMMAKPSTLPGQKGTSLSAAIHPTSSSFFSNNCFDGTKKETYSTNNNGSLPITTFRGNHLNLQTLTSAG